MSLCYHGLGFFGVQIILTEKKDYLPKKKKVEMAVLYDPRIIVPDLGTIKLSPVVFNFDCIFSLPKAFQNV